MPGPILFAAEDTIGAGIAVAGIAIALAAYFISVQWRKTRQAQMEADLKREMVQKGLSADDMEKVLKMSGPQPPLSG